MQIYNILLAVNGDATTPKAQQIVYGLILLAGAGILIAWFIRYLRNGRRDPLEHAPVRRHRIPLWFPPVQIVLWLGVAAFIAWISPRLKSPESESLQDLISYSLLGVWDFFLVGILLVIGYFGFVRGFWGMGLRLRTVPRDLGAAFLVFLASLPLIEAILGLTLFVGKFLHFQLETHPSLVSLEQHPQWWVQVLIIGFAVIVAPLIEELLFRGFFQSSLTGELQRPWVAIVITSVLFASLHQPTHWPALFVLSVLLGYSYEKSGSLFRPLFIHIFFNGFSILMTLWTFG